MNLKNIKNILISSILAITSVIVVIASFYTILALVVIFVTGLLVATIYFIISDEINVKVFNKRNKND